MKDQINTIREALVLGIKAINHLGGAREAMPLHDAMPALAQLEAMAGAQEPACDKCHGTGYYDEGHECDDGTMAGGNYIQCEKCAAPVAQQPNKVMLEKLREWEANGELIDRALRVLLSQEQEIMRLEKMRAEERAQQPQAEAVQYTRADLDRAYSAGLVEGERLAIQRAEAVPADQSKWCAYVAGVIGCYLGEADDSAKVKAIAGIIERRMWASAHQPLKIAAWRGVHVEGDYLYYDEFPEELTNEQRRQLHLKPLYEGAAPQQDEAVHCTRADLDRAYSAGLVEGERLAIQQAESVPSDVVRDAERYRKLRTFHWSEHSMCVVLDPKKSVRLGAVCPSGPNLDDYVDAAIAQQKGGVA